MESSASEPAKKNICGGSYERIALLTVVAVFLAASSAQLATAASVFVQFPVAPTLVTDPVFATQSGAGFFAEADLLAGTFKARSMSPDAGFSG